MGPSSRITWLNLISDIRFRVWLQTECGVGSEFGWPTSGDPPKSGSSTRLRLSIHRLKPILQTEHGLLSKSVQHVQQNIICWFWTEELSSNCVAVPPSLLSIFAKPHPESRRTHTPAQCMTGWACSSPPCSLIYNGKEQLSCWIHGIVKECLDPDQDPRVWEHPSSTHHGVLVAF